MTEEIMGMGLVELLVGEEKRTVLEGNTVSLYIICV